MADDGVLFTPRWIRVSRSEITVSECAEPTRLAAAAMPARRWIAAGQEPYPNISIGYQADGTRVQCAGCGGSPMSFGSSREALFLRYPEVVEFERGPA